MTEKTAEQTLREHAREIAQRERISHDAALKVACALEPNLSEKARAQRLGRPMIAATVPEIPPETRLAAEMLDRVQERQRKLRCSFGQAYAQVCEDEAPYFASDAAAAAVFVSLAAARARELGCELGQALDRLRIETPSLWRRASAARR